MKNLPIKNRVFVSSEVVHDFWTINSMTWIMGMSVTAPFLSSHFPPKKRSRHKQKKNTRHAHISTTCVKQFITTQLQCTNMCTRSLQKYEENNTRHFWTSSVQLPDTSPEDHSKTRWWLNQLPIWKTCSSNWIISQGWKTNLWNQPRDENSNISKVCQRSRVSKKNYGIHRNWF